MVWIRGHLANIVLSSLSCKKLSEGKQDGIGQAADNGAGSLQHEVAKMPYVHLEFVQ